MRRVAENRVPKTPFLSVYMDQELQALLKREARARGMGISELVRVAVARYLAGVDSLDEALAFGQANYPTSWEEYYRKVDALFRAAAAQAEAWRRHLGNMEEERE